MKHLVIMIMLLLTVNLFGQIQQRQVSTFAEIPAELLTHMEKMGVNDSSVLNKQEGNYLNVIFHFSRDNFDFTGKKIGFIIGSSGKKVSDKEDYFNMQKKYLANKNSPCDNGTLYIFDENQRKESAGYDAAIIYWSKVLMPIDDVVKKLKTENCEIKKVIKVTVESNDSYYMHLNCWTNPV